MDMLYARKTIILMIIKLIVIFNVWAQASAAGTTDTRTISNGLGDGSISIEVDLYGAFGASSSGGSAIYDPASTMLNARSSVELSAVYFSPASSFLAGGGAGASLTGGSFLAGGKTWALSRFSAGGYSILLYQNLSKNSGGNVSLFQKYNLRNVNGSTSVSLVRHLDGDLRFVGGFDNDFARSNKNGELLFAFDSGADQQNPTEFLSIEATGGNFDGFTIQPFRFFDDIVTEGGIPNEFLNMIEGDDDGNNITDNGYDVTLSQAYSMSIPVGSTKIFTTITSFGSTTIAANVELLDPSCEPTLSRNLRVCNKMTYLQSPDALLSDADMLLNANQTVDGAATDGVSMVMIRVASNQSVTMTLKKPNGANTQNTTPCIWGQLRSADGSSASCSSITVNPVMTNAGEYVFAAFRSPIDYPTELQGLAIDADLKVTIEFQSGAFDTTSSELRLVPPPVVLNHGLWSSPNAWIDSGFKSNLDTDGYTTFTTDYSAGGSAPTFHPASDSNSVNEFIDTIGDAKKFYQNGYKIGSKTYKIAVAQVDVVGHSMGGLITRTRVKYKKTPYENKSNLMAGDVHKLVTLGTPNHGAEVANVLIQNKGNTADAACIGLTLAQWWIAALACFEFSELGDVLSAAGKPLDVGVYDLQKGSPAILALGPTPIPTHAIAGDSDSFILPTASEAALNVLLALYLVGDTLDGIFDTEKHDTIVTVESQKGGFTNSSLFDVYEDTVHTALIPIDDDETSNEDIQMDASDYLLTKVSDASFGEYPQPVSTGVYTPFPTRSIALSKSRKSSKRPVLKSGAVTTILPLQGSTFDMGSQVEIRLDVVGGPSLEGVFFKIDEDVSFVMGSSPYVLQHTASSDVAGQVTVELTGVTTTDVAFVETTAFVVMPSTAPMGVTVSPDVALISDEDGVEQLMLEGEYGGGVGPVDITSPSVGTTYEVLAGFESILSVDANGLVLPVGNGVGVVNAMNSGMTASSMITVDISNFRPVFLQADNEILAVGSPQFTVGIDAMDPDGDEIQLSMTSGPSFLQFTDFGGGVGELQINSPAIDDIGEHDVFFLAEDDGIPQRNASMSIRISVSGGDILFANSFE